MATAQQLKALLQSYSEADGEMFVSVALQIAAHEARTGKGKFASEIKSLVDEIKGKQTGTGNFLSRRIVGCGGSHHGNLCQSRRLGPAALIAQLYAFVDCMRHAKRGALLFDILEIGLEHR